MPRNYALAPPILLLGTHVVLTSSLDWTKEYTGENP